jgi:hypothetical protein
VASYSLVLDRRVARYLLVLDIRGWEPLVISGQEPVGGRGLYGNNFIDKESNLTLFDPGQARVARHSSFWTGNVRGAHWSWTGEGGKALIILDRERTWGSLVLDRRRWQGTHHFSRH